MTRDEIMQLGRKVAAICPAQKFNADTPDAWEALLGWVDYDDALQALYVLGQTEKFIAPADIIREVRRLRAERLKGHVVPAPDVETADQPDRYRAHLHASVRAAAAPPSQRPAITVGPDEVTAARAAGLRANGAQVVTPGGHPQQECPARVREALAAAREACAAASAAAGQAMRELENTSEERVLAAAPLEVVPVGADLEAIVREETGQ